MATDVDYRCVKMANFHLFLTKFSVFDDGNRLQAFTVNDSIEVPSIATVA